MKHIETNIFRFKLTPDLMKSKGIKAHSEFTKLLREKHQILMSPSFADDMIRIVTHRDVDKKKLEQVVKAFKALI